MILGVAIVALLYSHSATVIEYLVYFLKQAARPGKVNCIDIKQLG